VNKRIYKSDTWLKSADPLVSEYSPEYHVKESYYPDNAAPKPPSPLTPMQGINAACARTFAGLLGCRLPTAGEWAAARANSKPATANLRGPTWSRQVEYLAHIKDLSWVQGAVNPTSYPNKGIFCLNEEPQIPAATSVWPRDNGVLWFADARPESTDFENLVGNVGEFVTAEPNSPDGRVIGGSSLSPPDVDPNIPCRPKFADDVYSDVGFRLAFNAPASSVKETLKALLRNPPPYAFAK
jgi:hypothetical protein